MYNKGEIDELKIGRDRDFRDSFCQTVAISVCGSGSSKMMLLLTVPHPIHHNWKSNK
jgi:hypothetical protein